MPLTKWQVEPMQLIPASSIGDNRTKGSELTDFINVMMTSVIRQLSCVSLYAEQVFNELATEAGGLVQRTSNLTQRVEQLKQYAKTLSPMDDEDVSVDKISTYKPFKSSAMRGVAWSSRSEAIKQTYNNAEPPPALQKLNCYREDGKNCLKLYTNPGFFFELWCSQIQQEVEKKRPARKKVEKKDTGFKAPVTQRKPEGVDLEFRGAVKPSTPKPVLNQPRGSSVSSASQSPSPTEKKEFPGTANLPAPARPPSTGSSPPTRPPVDPAPVIFRNERPAPPPPPPMSLYPPQCKMPAGLPSIGENEDDRNSDLPPPPSLYGRCKSILPPPPPTPVSASPTSRSTTTSSKVPAAGVPSRLPSAGSSFDELPTPPAPLAAGGPPISRVSGQPASGKRQTNRISRLSTAPPRMSMYLLGNSFDELSSLEEEDSAAMPPPPPPALLAPPPPPPPPANICLPPPPALESGFGLRPAASSHPVAQKKRESRSDLLDSIRQGIALRKVEEKQDTKKPEDVGAGLFDVQMILEMRRRALEDDDDSDYETGNDDDWDN